MLGYRSRRLAVKLEKRSETRRNECPDMHEWVFLCFKRLVSWSLMTVPALLLQLLCRVEWAGRGTASYGYLRRREMHLKKNTETWKEKERKTFLHSPHVEQHIIFPNTFRQHCPSSFCDCRLSFVLTSPPVLWHLASPVAPACSNHRDWAGRGQIISPSGPYPVCVMGGGESGRGRDIWLLNPHPHRRLWEDAAISILIYDLALWRHGRVSEGLRFFQFTKTCKTLPKQVNVHQIRYVAQKM